MEPDRAASVSPYPQNEILQSAKNTLRAGLTKFVRKFGPRLPP